MSAEQATAAALRSAGYRVHSSGGVWWIRRSPGFCKPMNPLQAIHRGAARPKWFRSPIGYSHVVPDAAEASHTWDVMMLGGERLKGFEIGYLKPRKRTAVRKALKELEIRRIDHIGPVLSAMNELSIATAKRTGHGRPPQYYIKKRSEWERFMRREFAIPGREWWGAFLEGRLLSYYYSYLINGTMIISAAKSDTAYLKLNPNDAVTFSFLEYCARLPDCHAVIYGDYSPEVKSLNEFKEQFGFEKKSLPVYRAESPLFKIARGLFRGLSRLRDRSSRNAQLSAHDASSVEG